MVPTGGHEVDSQGRIRRYIRKHDHAEPVGLSGRPRSERRSGGLCPEAGAIESRIKNQQRGEIGSLPAGGQGRGPGDEDRRAVGAVCCVRVPGSPKAREQYGEVWGTVAGKQHSEPNGMRLIVSKYARFLRFL